MPSRLPALWLTVVCAAAVPHAACAHRDGSELLAEGSMVPSLEATAHDGTLVRIGPGQDAPTVVYFYPRDGTPGCTREACAFRDAWKRYQTAGVRVVGVSGDSLASHREFSQEYDLPFPLVSDEDGAWARAFGVPSIMGILSRVTFLVGPDGTVERVYPDVDPALHADVVLADAARP